jgi:hypothetical protein
MLRIVNLRLVRSSTYSVGIDEECRHATTVTTVTQPQLQQLSSHPTMSITDFYSEKEQIMKELKKSVDEFNLLQEKVFINPEYITCINGNHYKRLELPQPSGIPDTKHYLAPDRIHMYSDLLLKHKQDLESLFDRLDRLELKKDSYIKHQT